MKTFFTIVFFKFFQFSKSIGNVDDDSYAFKSVAILSLFLSINFFAFVAYYRCLIQHSNDLQLSVLSEMLVVLAIGSLIYFIFYKDEKYKVYFEEVVKHSRFKDRKGTWLTIFYMFGSIAFLASAIWLHCG